MIFVMVFVFCLGFSDAAAERMKMSGKCDVFLMFWLSFMSLSTAAVIAVAERDEGEGEREGRRMEHLLFCLIW